MENETKLFENWLLIPGEKGANLLPYKVGQVFHLFPGFLSNSKIQLKMAAFATGYIAVSLFLLWNITDWVFNISCKIYIWVSWETKKSPASVPLKGQ